MNTKTAILVSLGLLACTLGFTQTDNSGAPAATNMTAAPAASADTNSVTPSAPAAPADTNAAPAAPPASAPVAATATVSGSATTVVVPDTNTTTTVTVQPATNAPSSVTVVVPATPAPVTVTARTEVSDEIIPLIQFQDVQLTTAIENLARQANLNYILDPRLDFNQVDERGQPKPQPNISIRWENVTAAQALNALLSNYGLQMVADPKTKISRITTKDPLAPDPLITRVVQLKYAACSNLVVAVQTTLTDKRSKVLGDQRTSQMVVVATDKEQAAVDALVAELDKPTRQVLIEARILETSTSPSSIKGVDWTGTLQAQNFSFGNGNINQSVSSSTTLIPGAAGTTTTPGTGRTISGPSSSSSTILQTIPGLSTMGGGITANTLAGLTPAIGFLNADGVNAVLSFLNSQADTRVISTPRAVTLDNETATLGVVRATPIFNVQASTQNTTGGSSVTYTNLGTILTVTPRISADDRIWLKVIPEVSSKFDTIEKTVAGQVNEADEYDIRRIETQVIVPNAHTLVMGGMLANDIANSYTKVPLLGDIPVLGYAFYHESKSQDKTDLIIFITPTIVADEDYQEDHTQFLKSSPSKSKLLLKHESFWESGRQAYDWSSGGHNADPDLTSDDTVGNGTTYQPADTSATK